MDRKAARTSGTEYHKVVLTTVILKWHFVLGIDELNGSLCQSSGDGLTLEVSSAFARDRNGGINVK